LGGARKHGVLTDDVRQSPESEQQNAVTARHHEDEPADGHQEHAGVERALDEMDNELLRVGQGARHPNSHADENAHLV
jgi:hypothetical protein